MAQDRFSEKAWPSRGIGMLMRKRWAAPKFSRTPPGGLAKPGLGALVTLALALSMDVQALTLGLVKGAALIGRPLEVMVQVQLDPNQRITSACFEADVFHADTRQNPDGVRVRLETTAATNGAVLRITSTSRVDEPVVTIYVRAGCAQMSSRQYVLLADIVSEQAAVMPRVESVPLVDGARMAGPSVPVAGAAAPVVASPGLARSGGSSDATVRSAGTSRLTMQSAAQRRDGAEARRAAPGRPAAVRSAAPAAAPRGVAAPSPSPSPRGVAAPSPVAAAATNRGFGQSRLELDPLDVLSERVATLESNANTPARVSEREALEIQRLDRLDASVKALLALAERNEASLLDVRNRLEKAQTDRFSNTVIYALFGMLLLCLLAIAYMLARINRGPETTGSRWFDAGPGSSDPVSVPPPVPAARSMPGRLQDAQGSTVAMTPRSVAADPIASTPGQLQTDRLPVDPTQPMRADGMMPASGAGSAQVDVSLVEMSESTFDRLMQSGSAHSAVRRAHETVPMAVVRSERVQAAAPVATRSRIKADDLVDIRQRAEFFVTLGQTDQAVQVLEARIEQDGASCPQIYLDLLQLFHSLGLKDDFSQLRDDFLRRFNAHVPEFADFDDEGRSLEEYPGPIDRLIRVWSRPTVLDALEELIYSSPAAQDGHEAFDLAAFRDLLMLHAVAQTVRTGAAGHSGAFRPQPIAAVDGCQVDIDLSELFASEVAPTLVLPRIGPGAAEPGSATGSEVDLQLDVGAPGSAEAAPPSDNLIDFDLGDTDVIKKSGSAS